MNSILDRYRGQDIPLMEGPRGARVAGSTLEGLTATFAVAPRMIEVAPRVWNLVGIGKTSIDELLKSGGAKSNRPDEVKRFIALFDDAQQAVTTDSTSTPQGAAA